MSRKDKERVLIVMQALKKGEIRGAKLKGKNQYRVRIGKYRLLYHIESNAIIFDHNKKRHEDTYK